MKISYIYIITNGEDYKVGVSVNPKRRIKQLQTGNPETLKIAATFKLPADKVYSLEKEAHREIQYKYQKRGEWFKGATFFHINLLVDMICDGHIIEE